MSPSDDLLERAPLVAQDIRNQRERLYAACISSDGWAPCIDELAAQLADLRGENKALRNTNEAIIDAASRTALEQRKEIKGLRAERDTLQQQNERLRAKLEPAPHSLGMAWKLQAEAGEADLGALRSRGQALVQQLADMKRANALVDEADGPQEYQTRLFAFALIAREFLRGAAALTAAWQEKA